MRRAGAHEAVGADGQHDRAADDGALAERARQPQPHDLALAAVGREPRARDDAALHAQRRSCRGSEPSTPAQRTDERHAAAAVDVQRAADEARRRRVLRRHLRRRRPPRRAARSRSACSEASARRPGRPGQQRDRRLARLEPAVADREVRAERDVGRAVAVDVADRGDRRGRSARRAVWPSTLEPRSGASAVERDRARRVARVRRDQPVSVPQRRRVGDAVDDPARARRRSRPPVVPVAADRHVVVAVAVRVADTGHAEPGRAAGRAADPVAVRAERRAVEQRAGGRRLRAVDDVGGVGVRRRRAVGADHDVADVVAVDVARAVDRDAQPVAGERAADREQVRGRRWRDRRARAWRR